jgi:hypothetical protein
MDRGRGGGGAIRAIRLSGNFTYFDCPVSQGGCSFKPCQLCKKKKSTIHPFVIFFDIDSFLY